MVKLFISLLFLSCLFITCGKDGTASPDLPENDDKILPAVEIFKPVENQQFRHNDTLRIEGRTSDNGVLHSATIKVINDANGSIVKQQYYDLHGMQSYNFNVVHIINISSGNSYTIRADIEDHFSNKNSKTVKVTVVP